MNKNKILQVLGVIETDVQMDIMELEGKLFDGKTVAELFGKQAAILVTLTKIIRALIEEDVT